MEILRPKIARVFLPLLEREKRYLGAYGGRGSGKSTFFALFIVIRAVQQSGFRAVCIRETKESTKDSTQASIAKQIFALGVGHLFDIQNDKIKTPGGGVIIFQGLQEHNADSIKSLEDFDVAWVEEAQKIGLRSWRLLRPTIRKPGSQIWASWNPENEHAAVDKFFRTGADLRTACVKANYRDNPWFPKELDEDRKDDLKRMDPSEYAHIWDGEYLTISEAVIFKNRVLYEQDIEPPLNTRFYHGLDFGFANDPSAFVRCWIDNEDSLCIDVAEGKEGIEIDDLPNLLNTVETAKNWPIKADGARPETISYLARRGFSISAAKKWQGSVEDGIERLKAFKCIKVSKKAEKIAREFRTYSYKVDKRTGDILPKIEDKNNHWIDALRYSLDGIITNKRTMPSFAKYARRRF
ncbi:PBSX family phage terminase large subunit [Acetobacteraceae bacterium]|nr:PBSX family phage terminase large subunit [Acetobacteraceae bacterium]